MRSSIPPSVGNTIVFTWCVFNRSRIVAQEVCRPASSSVFSIAVSK
jgi:hypothetical protein